MKVLSSGYFAGFLIITLIHVIVIAADRTTRNVASSSKSVTKAANAKASMSKKPPPTGMKDKFEQFKKKYKKQYATKEEEDEARKIFYENEKEDQTHNKRANETFTRGTNSYSDKSHEWKENHRMGAKKSARASSGRVSTSLPQRKPALSARMGDPQAEEIIPDEADWSEYCSPIKDQGDCGSCWSFAATALLEYLLIVIRGNVTILSEQELIDCDDTSSACNGGWPSYAYDYIIMNGITENNNYPYLSYQSDCISQKFSTVLYLNETFELELSGDEEQLKKLVYTLGPVAVVIYASQAFTQYVDGVYYEPDCPNDMESYNHAIVVVGYGTDYSTVPPKDYWLIRNSWSDQWGINGYGKMARNQENHCGIANYAMMPSSALIHVLDINEINNAE